MNEEELNIRFRQILLVNIPKNKNKKIKNVFNMCFSIHLK